MSAPKIRVLVVDDSAFARKTVRHALSNAADIEVVGHARDGFEALEQIGLLKPDVVTLDLDMPELDGLGVLSSIRESGAGGRAPQVVVVSAAASDGERALRALELGAIELFQKSALAIADAGTESLAHKVRLAAAAASAGVDVAAAPVMAASKAAAVQMPPAIAHGTGIVLVGTSTGGPRAITTILSCLPALPVPLVVVVHMPPGFTGPFAERLDRESVLHVREARQGMEIGPGDAVVAPAGVHLHVARLDMPGRARCRLVNEPADALHRPSVDELFLSAARSFGARALALVLTGMGSDGLQGAKAIRAAGGRIWTEAKATCVIDGMPRSIREAGLSQREIRLEELAAAIAGGL